MSEENYDINAVTALIISGLTAEQDDDTIRLEMFKQRVPFNKINTIFREVAIAEGFKADPKVVKQGIADELESVDAGFLAEWSDVQELVDATVAAVKHSTPGMVISALKAKAADAEVEFPKKPKKTGIKRHVTSKIKAAMVSILNANPKVTSQEMFDGLVGVLSGDAWIRNTIKYINMYLPVMVAAESGAALADVNIDSLDKDVLEKAYRDTLTEPILEVEVVGISADEEEVGEPPY